MRVTAILLSNAFHEFVPPNCLADFQFGFWENPRPGVWQGAGGWRWADRAIPGCDEPVMSRVATALIGLLGAYSGLLAPLVGFLLLAAGSLPGDID